MAPTGLTVDCAEVEVGRVTRAASDLGSRTGGPVVVVGHSRGGQLALVTAFRQPALVARVVTAGTPWRTGVPDQPVARAGAGLAAVAKRMCLPVPGSLACGYAPCCERFRTELAHPPAVPWVALWSKDDRVVSPANARLAGAQCVEVSGGHLRLVLSPANRQAIREAAFLPV